MNPTVIRVITWLPVGGIERRLCAALPRLKDHGWNVRLLCLREEGELAAELRDSGIPVDVIPMKSRLSPAGLRAIARHFRLHNASVVHTHMYRSNVPGAIAGKLAAVPAIFGHIHNVDSWDHQRQVWIDRLVTGFRTATFTVSRAVQRDVTARLRIPKRRAPVLYNGIDVQQFRPQPERREALRHQLKLPPQTPVFLIPARLHPQKNPEGVLAAAKTILGEGGNALFLFAGEGKLREALEEQVREAGCQQQIQLIGARDDMDALYNAADATILSSFKEGFSNAVVESLACGTPVIASDVGGNREAIAARSAGWIHQAGDGQALISQIKQAIRLGTDGLAAMAPACRERAENFSLEAMIRQTDRHYRRALGDALES